MGLLLDVIAGKPTPYAPVWFMRQAGRYMQEYQDIRRKHSFLEMCYRPELACEITLQPIKAFDVDAAILFSDILPPLEKMGLDLEFVKGVGPVIHNPILSNDGLKALRPVNAKDEFQYIADAVKLIRQELSDEKDLIGFCGAPFTMASYAIEGGSSKNFYKIKSMMYQNPELYDQILSAITEVTKEYVLIQLENGADILQIFDSWGGILSPDDYEKFAAPYTEKIIKHIRAHSKKPITLFVKGAGCYFEKLAQSEADVLGVDWSLKLNEAATKSQNKKVLQGNLDPIALLGTKETIACKLDEIKKQTQSVRHIFNLGHGIIPQTPVDNVKFAIDYWRSFDKI